MLRKDERLPLRNICCPNQSHQSKGANTDQVTTFLPNVAEAQNLKNKVQAENLPLEEIEREAEAGFHKEVRSLELGSPQLLR